MSEKLPLLPFCHNSLSRNGQILHWLACLALPGDAHSCTPLAFRCTARRQAVATGLYCPKSPVSGGASQAAAVSMTIHDHPSRNGPPPPLQPHSTACSRDTPVRRSNATALHHPATYRHEQHAQESPLSQGGACAPNPSCCACTPCCSKRTSRRPKRSGADRAAPQLSWPCPRCCCCHARHPSRSSPSSPWSAGHA